MINVNDLVRANPDYWLAALTDAEAAPFCGISAKHLQWLRQHGQGPAFTRVGPRAVRYKRCDLLAWMESRKDDGAVQRAKAVVA